MRRLALFVPVAALAFVAVPTGAGALPCNGTVTQVDTPVGTLYVDDRGVTEGGIWIYAESNDTVGLQSGGDSVILGDLDSDDCADPGVLPDTLIF